MMLIKRICSYTYIINIHSIYTIGKLLLLVLMGWPRKWCLFASFLLLILKRRLILIVISHLLIIKGFIFSKTKFLDFISGKLNFNVNFSFLFLFGVHLWFCKEGFRPFFFFYYWDQTLNGLIDRICQNVSKNKKDKNYGDFFPRIVFRSY